MILHADAELIASVVPVLYASAGDSYVFGYKLLLTSLFIAGGVL